MRAQTVPRSMDQITTQSRSSRRDASCVATALLIDLAFVVGYVAAHYISKSVSSYIEPTEPSGITREAPQQSGQQMKFDR